MGVSYNEEETKLNPLSTEITMLKGLLDGHLVAETSSVLLWPRALY